MRVVTVDFETAYSSDYTLSKQSTESYIADPRFEIIGFSYKINDEPAQWVPGSHDKIVIAAVLAGLNIPESFLLAHNTRFDGLILAQHFNIYPKFYLDTYSMANALVRPFTGSSSLAAVAQHLELGEKGDAVDIYKGKWLSNFTEDQLTYYGNYCCNDVELTYAAFKKLLSRFPQAELRAVNRTLRLYLQPKLKLDRAGLAVYKHDLEEEDARVLASLPSGVTKTQLVSNKQFAELLKGRGITADKKISKFTGQATDALGKKDGFMLKLVNHTDQYLSNLVKARIHFKSNIHKSRCDRLLEITSRSTDFRVPLIYGGAHTLRWSGDEKINAQNLPPGPLRDAVRAPDGYTMIAADLAQIEARLLAYLAGEHELIEQFRSNQDIYSIFASDVYRIPVTKETEPDKRFVGKVGILSLGFGAGGMKLSETLAGYGINIELHDCYVIIDTYRRKYPGIRDFWNYLTQLIVNIARGVAVLPYVAKCNKSNNTPAFTPINTFCLGDGAIELPTGIWMYYPGVKPSLVERSWVYGPDQTRLYGGALCENIIQALARVLLLEYIIALENKGLEIVHTIHDELLFCVEEARVTQAVELIKHVMTKPPSWAPTLPVSVDIHSGKSYAECK